jgi:hypothetical protein
VDKGREEDGSSHAPDFPSEFELEEVCEGWADSAAAGRTRDFDVKTDSGAHSR